MRNKTEVAARSLWAKKGCENGEFRWLPLMIHLQDTMGVADFLWNHWISNGQRSWIVSQIQNGNEAMAECLVRFLGGVHDIGKATPAFQMQPGNRDSADLDEELEQRVENAGFTGISDFDVRFRRFSHHALAAEVILEKQGVNRGVSSIVGAHHGRPVDHVTVLTDQMDAYSSNYYQTENTTEVSKLWEDTQEYITNWALEQSGLFHIDSIPELSKPAQVILSGLLIMADWIASNEHYFPLISIDRSTVDDMGRRFEHGIERWFRSRPIEFTEATSAEDLYRSRFGFDPRGFQKVVFDTVQEIDTPGILIIEAPMGCGKTEAALATAEQLAAKTGRGGLFFGLPTQATSNGMFPRILEWLNKVSDCYGLKASIQLKHGKAALNKEYRQLSSHIDEDEETEGTVITNQWFAGRKTAALDDYVVGTVDQFLLASLRQKHLALRHLGFDKKVVIIDEVHAYDAYMQQYLTESIKWMGAYGVPVVLLSATLPAAKRNDLIRGYLKGKGLRDTEIDLTGADILTEDYPLITYTDGNRVCQKRNFPKEKDRKVQIRGLSDAELTGTIKRLLSDGGILGIVVNTVRRAQEISRECIKLYGDDSVVILHSAYIATDRVKKEEMLLGLIGKNAIRPQRLIVVGTQVIEQSLDIDFDVMISDLCPMDLLIQRIGRLHRHSIARPAQHTNAVAYILGMSDTAEFDRGSAAVYGEYILARTQYFLPDEIRIPSSVSSLVQQVYRFDGAEPILDEPIKARYNEWKEDFYAAVRAKEQKASAFRIKDPKNVINTSRYNLIGWLDTPDTSDSDEKAYAQVRDIKETLEVIAVRRYGSNYGFFSPESEAESDISHHIAEPEVAQKLATQTLRLPYILTLKAGMETLISWLEEYNRKNLADWQRQPWLKGSLGIVFDENGIFRIPMEKCDFTMRYDCCYGLELNREE